MAVIVSLKAAPAAGEGGDSEYFVVAASVHREVARIPRDIPGADRRRPRAAVVVWASLRVIRVVTDPPANVREEEPEHSFSAGSRVGRSGAVGGS